MPDKSEKARRKSITNALRNEERGQARERLPLPATALQQLFDFLDEKLTENECAHTLKFTQEFARSRNLPQEPLVIWLQQHGGHCDCEVLANVEEVVENADRYKNDSL